MDKGGSSGEFRLFREVFPDGAPPRILLSGDIDIGSIRLTDTTLRDGQQGWRTLTVEEALHLYDVLSELAEGGSIISTELFPYTSRDREIIKEIQARGYDYPKPIGWIRCTRNDVRLAKEAGLEEVVMLASISDYHVKYKFGELRSEVFGKYLDAIQFAYENDLDVRVTLEDITRADLEGGVIPFILKLVDLAGKYGKMLIVKLADTLGLGLPFPEVPPPRGIPQVIRRIREATGLGPGNIEFHGHNDLGLVVANHLSAWLYGAGLSNCTLFGIGERAGNCPLEVMMVHYVGLTGREANLTAIKKAADLVRDMGFNIPEFYPLVGANAFRTKAGIHIDGLMKNPQVYLPFDPLKVLGIPYSVAVTPHSGRSAVALWMNRYVSPHIGMSYSKNDPVVRETYEEIVQLFERTKRRHPLTNEELWSIVAKHVPNLMKIMKEEGIERVED